MINQIQALSTLPKLLTQFEQLLSLEESFSQREKLYNLDAEVSLTLDRLSAVSSDFWADLIEKFGASLTFTISQEQQVLASNETGGLTSEKFEELKRVYGADLPVDLSLNINKKDLARILSLPSDDASHRFLLYLFDDRLPYLLSRNLLDCDRELWNGNADSQVVFLVCDNDVLLNGDYLVVCGGRYLEDLESYLRPDNAREAHLLADKMRSTRLANLSWETQWVNSITPFHFQVFKAENEDSSFLSRVCALQSARLFLLYNAEVTMKHENSIWSIYQHGQTPVRVAWPQLPEDARQEWADLRLEDDSNHLVSLIKWIYEPTWPTDRLSMTQLYLSEELRFYDAARSLPELLRQSARIESDLQSRWKSFIGKKLDGYSEQERKLEDDIAKAISAFDDQVSAIIKSLVDSGLAAAVAVTASFLTAYFRTPFNEIAFKIGLCVYAGYVLFFPIGISLMHQIGRYRASVKEFKSKRKRVEKRLEQKKVKEIVDESQFESNKSRLRRWLWRAAFIYLLLMAAALTAAFFLPNTLNS